MKGRGAGTAFRCRSLRPRDEGRETCPLMFSPHAAQLWTLRHFVHTGRPPSMAHDSRSPEAATALPHLLHVKQFGCQWAPRAVRACPSISRPQPAQVRRSRQSSHTGRPPSILNTPVSMTWAEGRSLAWQRGGRGKWSQTGPGQHAPTRPRAHSNHENVLGGDMYQRSVSPPFGGWGGNCPHCRLWFADTSLFDVDAVSALQTKLLF